MIRSMFNLKCKAGHYHYSPVPKVFEGRGCMKPLGDPLHRTSKKCDQPLRILR